MTVFDQQWRYAHSMVRRDEASELLEVAIVVIILAEFIRSLF